jgi:signal transduction histidine kinase
MLINESPTLLTSQKRAALPVLASQVAVAIENSRLNQEKVGLERQLQEQEKWAMLGQMAATIAHEVKNPLSSIKTIVQVMQEDEGLRTQFQQDMGLIIKEIDRLSRTVTQLLSFSRPPRSSGEPMSLDHLLEHTLALLSSEAQRADVRLEMDQRADALLSGQLAMGLSEVLSNLVLNAIQASPAGGRVSISAGLDAEGLAMSIEDQGGGIPPDVQPRIFEPFFTTKQRGTGLGLTIVKRRLTEMGGTISITSPISDGHGSRMAIRIPLQTEGAKT